jgi:hypothetical protein
MLDRILALIMETVGIVSNLLTDEEEYRKYVAPSQNG